LAPRCLKDGQALKGFCPRWRLKDRVRIGRDLLAPQSSCLLKAQGFLGARVGHHEIAIAELAFQATDFMHRTALLLGRGQVLSERSW
jgi:hypothetical protein